MTDLQKNQAIYQAMCEIAEKYFNQAIEKSEDFRKFMAETTTITVKELNNAPEWHDARFKISFEEEKINVDTFSCSFFGDNVFRLLLQFKSLANAKGDYEFTYEEEIPNEYIGSVDITFDNPSNAKLLANSVSDDELRPVMNMVLLEVNASSGDINFVASDGLELGIISNNPTKICTPHTEGDKVFQALFGKKDWKRICDYARKEKSAITFKIYERGIDEDGYNECTDTMVAILGKKRAKSQQAGRFPSWKSVLPDIAGMHHFFLSSEDVKEAQKWLSKVKTYSQYDSVNITAYKGSDLIYFDIDDNTRTFRLSAPSNITIGTKVNIKRLQSKKFCGFHLPKCGGGIIVDDANTDLTLLMPIENFCVRNKNEREVVLEAVAA